MISSAPLPVVFQVQADFVLDHLALALADLRHVDRDASGGNAEGPRHGAAPSPRWQRATATFIEKFLRPPQAQSDVVDVGSSDRF